MGGHYSGMSSQKRPILLAAVAAALLVPAPARAQSRVLVMAEPARRDALAEALRVELAAGDAEVVAADPPIGDTRVSRAASGQASACASGAIAAVWPDALEGAAGTVPLVRVAACADDEPRQAPLPTEALGDARAFALVAASLLDELLDPAEPEPLATTEIEIHADELGVDVSVRVPTEAVAATPLAVPALTASRPAPVPWVETTGGSPVERGARRSPVGVYGGIALAGIAILNDVTDDVGPATRALVGLRFGRLVRVGLEVDGALIYEEREIYSGLTPMLRAGGVFALHLPVGNARVILGTHTRFVVSRTWVRDWLDEAGSVQIDVVATGVSAGGRIGAAIPLHSGLDLEVFAEVDGMHLDTPGRGAWLVPSIVVGTTWR